LPIPNVEAVARAEVVERAKQLYICSTAIPVVELEQKWNALYEQQERAICALYTAALPASVAITSM